MGNTILEFSFQEAKKLDVFTILGFIFAHNTPSIKLFEKHGFTVWGHLPNIALLDGEERSLKILGKRLSN